MGRPRKIPAVETATVTMTAETMGLAEFIAQAEGRHLDRDVFAVELTHPEVDAPRVHPGRFSGIRLIPGTASVRYSDGSTE